MKKIKIFIGSSIDDLAYERRDLVSFIAELNNKYIDRGIYIEPYICEEKSNEMRPEGSQKAHDDYIENDADAMIFMFFKKAGKYTLRELQIAKDTLESKDKKSHVFIYFKTINNEVADTSEIKDAIDKIAGEYAHYYKKFSEADTIKLELLQYLSDALGEESLAIHNGKVYIGDVEVNDIELSNVFAYQNNTELLALRKELEELEKQIQSCVEEKNWSMLAELSDKHRAKQVQYSNLESEILRMLQQLYKSLREERINSIRLRALMLLEEGKHKEALLLLPLDEIKSRSNAVIEKKALQEANIKQEANEILQDAIARLSALGFDMNRETTDIEFEKTYDSILDVALIAGKSYILIDYVDFLIEKGDTDKALYIAKMIESNFDAFDDVDLYTKYDTYNLLAELSDTEDEQQYFCELAKESLFSYIRSLDKNDWKEYVNACYRLSKLVWDAQEVLPFLKEAAEILEAHPEVHGQEWKSHDLYFTIAVLLYKETSDAELAEIYFNKDIAIAERKISYEGISDAFFRKIEEKKDDYKIPKDVLFWQSKLIITYEYLYEINSKQYEKAYIEHLFLYAIMLFMNNKYKLSLDYIYKAAEIAGDNEEYKLLRDFVGN